MTPQKFYKSIRLMQIGVSILGLLNITILLLVIYSRVEEVYIPYLKEISLWIWIINIICAIFFIAFIWRNYPVNSQQKWKYTMFVVIFNWLGMWISLPNAEQMRELRNSEKIPN